MSERTIEGIVLELRSARVQLRALGAEWAEASAAADRLVKQQYEVHQRALRLGFELDALIDPPAPVAGERSL